MLIAVNAIAGTVRNRTTRGARCTCAAPAVVVLFVLIGGTSRAVASCGDYVMVGATHSDSHASFSGSDAADESSPAPRCRGLFCQRRLPTPATPGKSLVGAGPHQWAWHAALADADRRIVGLCPPSPAQSDLEGHISLLLRPPIAAQWL